MLLSEKPPSDIENEAGRVDISTRLSPSPSHSPPTRFPRPITHLVSRTILFLIPSFLRTPHHPPPSHPTSHLDGLRGLAALIVFHCHLSYTTFLIAPGYGYQYPLNTNPLKLPLIRLLYSGPPMVCLFFVVSGYALSTKPLRLLHTHTHHATSFAPTLSSLVFRRSIRLFLPPAISTLLIVALLRAGLYEHTRPFATSSHFLRNVHETHYHRLPSLADQLADWARTQWDFIHVWDWKPYGGSNGMDVHLWTIPVEFRCSMLLFLSLLGTASLRPTVRLLVVVFLATFCYFHGRWDMLLFYAGMFLAEVDNMLLLLLPVVVVPFPRAASSSFAGADDDDDADKKWIPISLVGLYLMSQPDQGSDATPGWVRLSELIPEWWPGDDRHRYFQCFGAVVFVGAVGRSPAWRRILNSGAVQYLGRISYAMYLMHGPVMHTLGYAVQWAVWTVVGTDGLAYNLGFAVSALIIIPLVVCISDIFWRAVDAPTVRFAKWVESKCVVHE